MANLLPQLLYQGEPNTVSLADRNNTVWLRATPDGLVFKYGANSTIPDPGAILALSVPPGASGGISPSLLDANGQFSRLGLNTIGAANAGLSNSVWVSNRRDNLLGSGTKDDPFNGTTATLFDAVLAQCGANTSIYLGPGTYPTLNGIIVKTGWQLMGSGRGVTTIQFAGFRPNYWGPNGASIVQGDAGGNLGNPRNNITLRNITFDLNYNGLNPAAPANTHVAGVGLLGDGILLDNIEIINGFSNGNSQEGFYIAVSGNGGQIPMVTNCLIHNYAAGTSNTTGFDSGNGIFMNCMDDGSSHGFTVNAGLLIGCTSTSNTSVGFYVDTFVVTALKLIANNFSAATIPIQFNSAAAVADLLISENTLTSNNQSASGNAAIVFSGSVGGSNIKILGNTYNYSGNQSSTFLVQNNGTQVYTGFCVDKNYVNFANSSLKTAAFTGSFIGNNFYNNAWQTT